MPMSAAERQRKRRAKLKSQEPDKYEEKKRKHAEYMKNKRKLTGHLSATEQNKRRKQWREANARRANKKSKKMKNDIKTLISYSNSFKRLSLLFK